MNRILLDLVQGVVAGEITAAQAMQAAWNSGILEGMARQRVATALRPQCSRKPGRACQADYGEPARCEWCERLLP